MKEVYEVKYIIEQIVSDFIFQSRVSVEKIRMNCFSFVIFGKNTIVKEFINNFLKIEY